MPPIGPKSGDPRLSYHLMVVLPAGSSFAQQAPCNAEWERTYWDARSMGVRRFAFDLSGAAVDSSGVSTCPRCGEAFRAKRCPVPNVAGGPPATAAPRGSHLVN